MRTVKLVFGERSQSMELLFLISIKIAYNLTPSHGFMVLQEKATDIEELYGAGSSVFYR